MVPVMAKKFQPRADLKPVNISKLSVSMMEDGRYVVPQYMGADGQWHDFYFKNRTNNWNGDAKAVQFLTYKFADSFLDGVWQGFLPRVAIWNRITCTASFIRKRCVSGKNGCCGNESLPDTLMK